MNFLENIFRHLRESAERPVLQEIHGDTITAASGQELLSLIRSARSFLRQAGLKRGDRCALLAPNSIHWTAIDLAIIAEGAIVVPLYSRQSADELVAMLKDASPSLICCGDISLRTNIIRAWQEAPACHILKEIFASRPKPEAAKPPDSDEPPVSLSGSDPVAIIYTSGTSGEPKGVVLNVTNLNHVLQCTTTRLDQLMTSNDNPERVFHYAPFCFGASWLLLLSCLLRHSLLSLSTDLGNIADELRRAAPNYFLNVPVMLERMRARIEDQLRERGGPVSFMFRKARGEWLLQENGGRTRAGAFWLALARTAIFPAIRKRLGPNLKALICGSAPLLQETQTFYMMLGIPVLQVYGLTETTGICTMDTPGRIRPGWVGTAIEGCEMKLGEMDEILVRGPNVFSGYWNRPDASANVLHDGWFHSGDQGETADGYWRITGRIKNLIVLSSGHNVAPEPLEDKLLQTLAGPQQGAQQGVHQVVVIGNGRSHLSAIITGESNEDEIRKAIEKVNPHLPHYKRIHGFHLVREPFSADNGLLTANGKYKRGAIAERYKEEIENIYRKQSA